MKSKFMIEVIETNNKELKYKELSLDNIPSNGFYIVDIDNTLCNNEHRVHYIKQEKPDWDTFFKQCIYDSPIQGNILLNNSLIYNDYDVWLVTGRSTICAYETVMWLKYHDVYYDRLFMRPEGDYRPDYILKQEFINSLPNHGKESIIACVDDNDDVVNMYLKLGLNVLQPRS